MYVCRHHDLLLAAADCLTGLVHENPDLLGHVQQNCLETVFATSTSCVYLFYATPPAPCNLPSVEPVPSGC